MPVLLFKEIKPKTLNQKKMKSVLDNALKECANELLLEFEATTWSWKKKVKFVKLIQYGPNSVEILVGTDDEIYRYVDEGTKRHFVAPKNKPALAWQTGGSPKTVSGKMVATAGKAPSGPMAYDSRGHYVSGIKARKFTKTIQKSWEKKFKTRMEKAMKQAAQASDNFYSAGFWR